MSSSDASRVAAATARAQPSAGDGDGDGLPGSGQPERGVRYRSPDAGHVNGAQTCRPARARAVGADGRGARAHGHRHRRRRHERVDRVPRVSARRIDGRGGPDGAVAQLGARPAHRHLGHRPIRLGQDQRRGNLHVHVHDAWQLCVLVHDPPDDARQGGRAAGGLAAPRPSARRPREPVQNERTARARDGRARAGRAARREAGAAVAVARRLVDHDRSRAARRRRQGDVHDQRERAPQAARRRARSRRRTAAVSARHSAPSPAQPARAASDAGRPQLRCASAAA